MPNGWIAFGGTSSADMTNTVHVRKVPSLSRSARKADVFSVPGRDGDIILQQDAWENQKQTYELWAGDENAAAAASELADWLYSLDGYQVLEDSWETDIYRNAYLIDEIDIESIMGVVGKVELTFSCEPRRYLNSGKVTTTLTATGTIINPTVFTAKPLLLVTASEMIQGTIACGGNILSIAANVDTMMIDCQTCQAYSTDGTTYYNTLVTGSFPEIPEGTQTFTITGNITSVVITPRWFRR